MNKALIKIAILALPAAFSVATPLAASAQEAAAAHYSVNSTLIGTLLDDPAAAAILERIIPSIYANEMFKTMGRSQTLAAIQQYEPAALSNEVLAQIQAEFDKIGMAH